MSKNPPTIGIDLGTTYSCVAVYQHGKVEIIANQGCRTTPSCVAFKETECVVGEAAKDYIRSNPESTVFNVKRLIGRKFTDKTVQNDLVKLPFEIFNSNGSPKIRVIDNGERKEFLPEEISAKVLSTMKETAETYLGMKVTDAVITVPAYFSDAQRQATIDAGTIAKLNVNRIINEPNAAAIAYASDKKLKDKQNILVYDLGGGTFDVSILTVEGRNFEVKAVGGNTHLGGEDFDDLMVSHFVKEIKETFEIDLKTNKRSMRRLKTECEKRKRYLSSAVESTIEVEALFNGKDFTSKVTRACFDDLNRDFFQSTIDIVEKTLKDANMKKTEINEILLVGGSSRIPKVQELLQNFFNGKPLNMSINGDEAVAYGAAVQAAILDKTYDIPNTILVDVTPLSLGIETRGDIMDILICRNTQIPIKKTKTFSTADDFQEKVALNIYEGERLISSENNLLGSFVLEGISLKERNLVKIDVTFEIDVNGILIVTAIEKDTLNQNGIKISSKRGRLSEIEIQRLIRNAENRLIDDQNRRIFAEEKNQLENYCGDVKYAFNKTKLNENILEKNRNQILTICDDITKNMKTLKISQKSQFESMKNNLEHLVKKHNVTVKRN